MRRSFFGRSPVRTALAASVLMLCSVVSAVPAQAQVNTGSSTPVTRAQVRAELEELVAAGYNPRDWYHYPDNLWAAQRIVDQRHAALAQANSGSASSVQKQSTVAAPAPQTNESMGGVVGATSASGGPAPKVGTDQGRLPGSDGTWCARGPQCDIFFGHH